MSETIVMDYSMVLFDGSRALVSETMPRPMLDALERLLVTVAIRLARADLQERYEVDRFDCGMRMLHLPDGTIGMIMVGGVTPIDAQVFSDFLLDTEGFWSDRNHRFPCYHARTLEATARFIGHVSVEEACR